MQRHAEADRRYDQALAAARDAKDGGLEATFLQHQGSLASETGDIDRAATLYDETLDRFR